MPTRQRLPATRMLCAKHGNKRAQTGDFFSPLPHFAHDDRSETSTFTQSALRARTYARLSWFSFFAFTSSPALHKSLLVSALRVKTLSFSSSHRSSPSDRIINNSKQSLFQQNKTRQLPFLLRSIGGEGKKPKAFTPNKLLHKDLSTPREGVKGKNENRLTRTREGGRFLHTACMRNLTSIPDSKNTDTGIENVYGSSDIWSDDLLKRRKGHVYKTIVVDLKSGRILYVGQGKAADALADFGKGSDERSSTSSISPPISLPLSSPPYLKLPERRACLRPFSCGQTNE